VNTLSYDRLSRLESVRLEGVSGGHAVAEKRVDFGYNAAGQFEQISRFADVAGTQRVIDTHYEYDALGRLDELFHWTDNYGALASYAYTYDAANRITSISSADGLRSYTYDVTDQLTQVHSPSQVFEQYTYDANGNRDPGYFVGPNNRVTGISYSYVGANNYYYNVNESYWYDAEGNRRQRNRAVNDGTYTTTLFRWDHRNRLVEINNVNPQWPLAGTPGEDYGWGVSYVEASFGTGEDLVEWTAAVHSAQEGDAVRLEITSSKGQWFEYKLENVSAARDSDYIDYDPLSTGWARVWVQGDAPTDLFFPTKANDGVETNESFRVLVRLDDNADSQETLEADIWDFTNLVTSSIKQTYDPLDRWIRRSVDSDGPESPAAAIDTFFSWEGGQIALQFDGDPGENGAGPDDLSHRYLWGPAVDQILADESVTSLTTAGSVLWPLADHLGTPRDLARYYGNGDTEIVNHRVYDSFGNLISQTNANFQTIVGFTGAIFDASTGLNHHRARWLDMRTGTWMSEDPITIFGGDANFYRYVGNSPLNLADPSGLLGVGHHYFPAKGLEDMFRAGRIDAASYLLGMGYTSGPIPGHTYKDHPDYTKHVKALLDKYLDDLGKKTACIDDMKNFLDHISKGLNPVTGKADPVLEGFLDKHVRGKVTKAFDNSNIGDVMARALRDPRTRRLFDSLGKSALDRALKAALRKALSEAAQQAAKSAMKGVARWWDSPLPGPIDAAFFGYDYATSPYGDDVQTLFGPRLDYAIEELFWFLKPEKRPWHVELEFRLKLREAEQCYDK
jgi:RHS repeat-associated protein